MKQCLEYWCSPGYPGYPSNASLYIHKYIQHIYLESSQKKVNLEHFIVGSNIKNIKLKFKSSKFQKTVQEKCDVISIFQTQKLIHKYLPTYYRKKASARSLSKQRICTPTGIVRQIFTGTGKMILFGLCSRFDYILWIHLGEYKSSLFWGKIEKNLFNFDNSFSYYTIISCHRYEIMSS